MSESGEQWTVYFYRDPRGNCPVQDYLAGLPPDERATVWHQLRLLRQFGTRLHRPYAARVTGHKPLWELRPQPNRVLYFAASGRRFVVLHACRKKGRKLELRDIETAERRMHDFLEGER